MTILLLGVAGALLFGATRHGPSIPSVLAAVGAALLLAVSEATAIQAFILAGVAVALGMAFRPRAAGGDA